MKVLKRRPVVKIEHWLNIVTWKGYLEAGERRGKKVDKEEPKAKCREGDAETSKGIEKTIKQEESVSKEARRGEI